MQYEGQMQQRSASCPRRIVEVESFLVGLHLLLVFNLVFPEEVKGVLQSAVENGHREVLELLISAKARVFPQGREGWTAVHEAASNVGDRKLCLSREQKAPKGSQDGRTIIRFERGWKRLASPGLVCTCHFLCN